MGNHQGRGGDGYYRKRGIWYFRAPRWNGAAKSISTGTKVLAEARTFRKNYLENHVVGTDTRCAERVLMHEATTVRRETHSVRLRRRTRFSQISSMKNIDRIIGDMPLGKITIDTIKRYQAQRISEGAAAGTINNETAMIKTMLVERNLWRRLGDGYKPLKANSEVGRNWTMEEIEAVLTTAANGKHPWYLLPVLQLDFETGLRHKEIRCLRRRSFDFSRHLIVVERSTTKTKTGSRTVPMNGTAEFIAKRILAQAERLGSTRAEHFVFPGWAKCSGYGSDPTRPLHTFNKAFDNLRRDAGVDPSLRIHDVRHHVTSDLAESDLSSAIACSVLGWTSVRMRRHYEHLRSSASDRAMDRLEEVRRKTGRVITPLPAASFANLYQDGEGI